MVHASFLFAYIGPETILPIGSALAAIGGVVLVFWNSLRRGAAWCFRAGKRGSESDATELSADEASSARTG